MKKPKYVIFDCDGVLVESEIIANRIEAEYKTELGFPTTLEEQIGKFVGLGFSSPAMVEELKRLPPEYWKNIDERCFEAYRKELKAVDGVHDVLESLPLPKCVASSSKPYSLDLKLNLTNLKKHFGEAIFHGEMVKTCKPAPDLFLHATSVMGWHPSEGLVIEDSIAGVTAGKAAGLTVCGFVGASHIYPGHTERLLAAGADFIISDLRKVLMLV